jgi:hypothetical protein
MNIMSKTVHIFKPGQGVDVPDDLCQLTIYPGSTVQQALEAAGLTGYMLRTEDAFLAGSDDLYQKVTAGAKLIAAMWMQVG